MLGQDLRLCCIIYYIITFIVLFGASDYVRMALGTIFMLD